MVSWPSSGSRSRRSWLKWPPRVCPSCEFWPNSLSYADVDLNHVVGHRQVTDAYLLALARTHSATLVTFDAALAGWASTETLVPPD